MRMTRLFSRTSRDYLGQPNVLSRQLLVKSGYIQSGSSGRLTYLPLGSQTYKQIKNMMETGLERLGFQQIRSLAGHSGDALVPGNPLEPHLEAHTAIQAEIQGDPYDRRSIIADLVRRHIHSYKQLPQSIFFEHLKRMNRSSQKSGSIAPDECSIIAGFIFAADEGELIRELDTVKNWAINNLDTLAIPSIIILPKSDDPYTKPQEFYCLDSHGEDSILKCNHCGYTAKKDEAIFRKPTPEPEEMLVRRKIATPDCRTIAELASFLKISETKTAKAIFVSGSLPDGDKTVEKLVIAVIRGDMEVSLKKLTAAIGAVELRPATEAEILAAGSVPGYGSPINVHDSLVVVDDLISACHNLVAGANEPGFHFLNSNYNRDYQANLVVDIAQAKEGDCCIQCGSELAATSGIKCIEIGSGGAAGSWKMDCSYLDVQGISRDIMVGSINIWLDHLLFCIAEKNHDEHGFLWPIAAAPFHVHLVLLGGKNMNSPITDLADNIYLQLINANIRVLFDDRQESPGVKFNDADLIGLPVRITVSERNAAAGGIEMKFRNSTEKLFVKYEDLVPNLQDWLSKN